MNSTSLLLAVLALTTTAAFGKTIPNNAEASLVLGQVDFISNLAPFPPNAASLGLPVSVVVDPVTRKVFVAEEGSDRVLRYASADALANGAQAEAVFGQALFTTQTVAVTSNQFGGNPGSIFLDTKGRLWVPDFVGNRVLRFDSASSCGSSPSASRVYGQPDFTTSTAATTSTGMDHPYAVCVDSADRLWVADTDNNRVLRFDSITTKPSGAAADGVLGQADFITATAGSGNNGMDFPSGVTTSTGGSLYVTSHRACRVMRFDNASGLGANAPASAVLGQPDFATTTEGTTAVTMRSPNGAWITPDDSLWVADTNNRRVLRFNNASTKPSGAAADGVLGQPNFTSDIFLTTQRAMDFPGYRPSVDTTGSLWVADVASHRVLRFSPDATPPLLVVTAPAKVTKKPTLVIKGTASDTSGISKVEYRIGKGPLKLAPGKTSWSFTANLKKGVNTITIVATDNGGNPSVSRIIKITRK